MSKNSNFKKICARVLCAFMTVVLLMLTVSLSACQKKEEGYALGIGAFLEESTDALSVKATAAAVVTDGDGKIVLCRVDCSEAKATITDGKVSVEGVEKTKYELGKELSVGDGKYFYEGANFFENYVKGKTLSDIEALEKADTEGKLDADLIDGCITDPTGFIRAVKRAMISERKASLSPSDGLTAGLGIDTSVKGSSEEVTFVYGFAATAVADGKVSASVIDAAEAEITVENGKGKEFIYAGTKLELGDGYGMVKNGGAAAEWYVQSANYAKTANGKAPDGISSLPVEKVSGCTMDARPLKDSLVRAKENIR